MESTMYFYSSQASNTQQLNNTWGDFNKLINFLIDGGELIDIVSIEPDSSNTVKITYDNTKVMPWVQYMTITISGSATYNGNYFIESVNDTEKYVIAYNSNVSIIGAITEISDGVSIILKANTIACGATRLLGGNTDNRTVLRFNSGTEYRIDDRDFGPLVTPPVTFNSSWAKVARITMAAHYDTLDSTSDRIDPYHVSVPTESIEPVNNYIGRSIIPYNIVNAAAYSITLNVTPGVCHYRAWANEYAIMIQIFRGAYDNTYSDFFMFGDFYTVDDSKLNGIIQSIRPGDSGYDDTSVLYFDQTDTITRGGFTHSIVSRVIQNLRIYNDSVDNCIDATLYGSGGYGSANPSGINGFPEPNLPDGSLYFSPVQIINTGSGYYGDLIDVLWSHNNLTAGAGELFLVNGSYYMNQKSYNSNTLIGLTR